MAQYTDWTWLLFLFSTPLGTWLRYLALPHCTELKLDQKCTYSGKEITRRRTVALDLGNLGLATNLSAPTAHIRNTMILLLSSPPPYYIFSSQKICWYHMGTALGQRAYQVINTCRHNPKRWQVLLCWSFSTLTNALGVRTRLWWTFGLAGGSPHKSLR